MKCLRATAVALCILAAACGGTGAPAHVDAPADAGSPQVPPPSPDAGGASEGSSRDAGAPDAGAPDAGAPDAGTALSTSCDGVVPQLGPSIALDLKSPDGGVMWCSAARPDDGDGTVPIKRLFPFDNGIDSTFWDFYRARDGQLLNSVGYGGTDPGYLLTQPQGFHGPDFSYGPGVKLYDHQGYRAGDAVMASSSMLLEVDPNGGTAGLQAPDQPFNGTWSVRYWRLDAAGRAEVSAKVLASGPGDYAGPGGSGLGISLHDGHTLVSWTFGPGQCHAFWLDRAGNALAPDLGPSPCPDRGTVFFPLLDGSLVSASATVGSTRVLGDHYPDASATVTPLPEWLRTRATLSDGLVLLPFGKGYALRQSGAQAMELFAPAGNKCGELVTDEMKNGRYWIGRDGTLVVQEGPFTSCRVRWYPQLWR